MAVTCHGPHQFAAGAGGRRAGGAAGNRRDALADDVHIELRTAELNEIARQSGVGMMLQEKALPVEPAGTSPEELSTYLNEEMDRIRLLVKLGALKPE